MKSIEKNEEYSLINYLLKLEDQLCSKKVDRFNCLNAHEIAKNEYTQKELSESIGKVKDQLAEIISGSTSINIIESLRKRFNQMKTEISEEKNDFAISLKQGTVLDNYFAAKILYEIKCVVNSDLQELRKPFLYFTDDTLDSLDKSQLIAFYETEIDVLSKIEPVNYLKIREYYSNFEGKLEKICNGESIVS